MNTKNFLLFILFLPIGNLWADGEHLPNYELDDLVVQSSPLLFDETNSTQSFNVIQKTALSDLSSTTIAQTLANQAGISQTFYGPNANRPIIRGLGGFRVSVLENGLRAFDLSSTSADHAVSVDPILINRIEVLKGSSALLYGSNAIGGVVNVFNNTIPNPYLSKSFDNKISVRYCSVDEGWQRGGILFHQLGNFIFQINGSSLSTENYDVPDFIPVDSHGHDDHDDDDGEDGHDDHDGDNGAVLVKNSVDNTQSSTQTSGVGGSYLYDDGYVGVSYSTYDSTYGVPNHESSIVAIQRDKTSIQGFHQFDDGYFDNVSYAMTFGDYSHSEASGSDDHDDDDGEDGHDDDGEDGHDDDGEDGHDDDDGHDDHHHAVFLYDGIDSRFIFSRKTDASLLALSVNYTNYDMKIDGDESYLSANDHGNNSVPESTNPRIENDSTESFGIGLLQKQNISSNLTINGGIRYDISNRDYDALSRDGLGNVNIDRDDSSVNGSIGFVFSTNDSTSLSGNFHYSERIPETSELYSSGAHHATEAFEIGNSSLENEESIGIEISIRNKRGNFGQKLSAYYNNYDNFIYQNSSGENTVGDGETFIIRNYDGSEARIYGLEYEYRYQLGDRSYIQGFADLISTKDTTNDRVLPRIPPWRFGIGYYYNNKDFRFNLNSIHNKSSRALSSNESKTGEFTILNARLGFVLNEENSSEIYIKAKNITDELGFSHTSFLKNAAPLPGRSFELGMNYKF